MVRPDLDNGPSAEELEPIRRFIEETDIDVMSDELRSLVEKLPPRRVQ
jgi:hypothetical protein